MNALFKELSSFVLATNFKKVIFQNELVVVIILH